VGALNIYERLVVSLFMVAATIGILSPPESTPVYDDTKLRLEIAQLKMQLNSVITSTELNNQMIQGNTDRYRRVSEAQNEYFKQFNRMQDKFARSK
jgi:hypothetical protein